MADEPEDDVLELEDELTEEEGEIEEQDESDESEPEEEGEEEEFIGFEGEEAAPASAERETNLVRDLGAKVRELQRERALSEQPKVEIGPKPDLWDDCEGDPAKFEVALDAWKERKADAEKQEASQNETRERAVAEWQADHEVYVSQKGKLGRPDFDHAETAVQMALSDAQQSVIVMAADNKAALVYALGKSPARLAELAKITNPIKLAKAVAELERNLKVQSRRKAPEPDERMRGDGRVSSGSGDKVLERLEREAERTGDRSKIVAHKRQMKAKATN